jgi:small-conductance mechanosensitive channel
MVEVFGVTLAWPVFLKLAAAVLLVLSGSVVVAIRLERALGRWTQRRGLGDGQQLRVRRFILPVLLVGALHLTLSALDLPRNLHAVVTQLLSVINLALALYLIAQVALGLLARLTARTEAGRRVSSEVLTLSRMALLVIFGALLLDNLGIHLTALLTTLGIGSLALALALQDTLSNFFAGLYLRADHPVRPGDYIRVDTGDEGTVMQIGWRSTRLRTLANNIVVLPNDRLAKAVVTNYQLPDPRVSFDVQVTVPYDTDLARVEELLLDAAKRAGAEASGIITDPPPGVRLTGFGPTGLELTLGGRVREFKDQSTAQHAIRKQIVTLFRDAAIDMPPLRLLGIANVGDGGRTGTAANWTERPPPG